MPTIDALSNPVIDGIEFCADNNPLDERIAGHGDEAVRNNVNCERVSLGNAVDFAFYRTGVGIDIDRCWATHIRHDLRSGVGTAARGKVAASGATQGGHGELQILPSNYAAA